MNDYRQMREYLMHHGIKGQKWGVRRFQNEDGSLTLAGEERYLKGNDLKDMSGDSRFKNAQSIGNAMASLTNKHDRSSTKNTRLYIAALREAEKNGQRDLSKEDKRKFDDIFQQMLSEKAKENKEFIRKFEEENGVKVVRYQDIPDTNQMVYTDGNKYYSIYRGGKSYFNFRDVTQETNRILKTYGNYYFNIKDGTTDEWEDAIRDGEELAKKLTK